MIETELRTALAKKLGCEGVILDQNTGLLIDSNYDLIPSLYDLCKQGEERLTEEQQSVYLNALFGTEVSDRAIFAAIRLSNLNERAKVLIEVLP